MIQDFDRKIFLIINNGWKNNYFDYLFGGFTIIGLTPIIITITALILYFLDKNEFKKNLLICVICILFGGLLVQIIKEIIDRPRPLYDLKELIINGKIKVHFLFENLEHKSFPSGHTQSIFSILTFFFIKYREKVILILFFSVLAIMISLSRIYAGAHYPTDIFGGAIVGIISSLIIIYLPKIYEKK